MFDNYPKVRPALPQEISEIYSSQYKSNRQGNTAASSWAQRLESWMHRQVADDLAKKGGIDSATLELGAGTLNQLEYESTVSPYDIVEPFTELYKDSVHLRRIRSIFKDIDEIPIETRYHRITSIAALEHICNLPEVVARSGLLLDANGEFRASIPSEGTVLWKLGWKLTTGLEFRLKHGLDYGLLMKHEHVNTAAEIEEVLQYFFTDIRCKLFGVSKAFSLYRYYQCSKPKLNRCSEYLFTLSNKVNR